MTIKQAMVLAAGRGERLKPLTDRLPKALVLVKEKPLLVHHLQKLANAGFDRVVINLGWLGEQIPKALAEWLKGPALSKLEVVYSQEPPGALETAGGIHHALEYFQSKPFALISADVMSDFDYRRLRDHGLLAEGHLVLVDNPSHHPTGDFSLIGCQVLESDAQSRHTKTLTYSGLGVFTPTLFESLSPGRQRLRPVLDQAIASNTLSGEHYLGRWLDIGTPERLISAKSQTWD